METHVQNVLVGSLLGDGWLDPLSQRTKTTRYRVKYNDKSLGYLRWIRAQLQELDPSRLRAIPKYSQHTFYTRSRTDLSIFRELFYPQEGVKRVPKNISELLADPMSLAIWYQDDGTLDRRSNYHWNARIATYCFPYEDCTKLKATLQQNFGIDVSVCRNLMRGKVYYELYVLSKSMERFIEAVQPYIHKDYSYKILRLAANNGQQER